MAPIASECLSRAELSQRQAADLRRLVSLAWERSAFYRHKWQAAGIQDPAAIATLADLQRLPLTSRTELPNGEGGWRDLSTAAPEDFVTVHRSAGASAPAVFWYDTEESWQWVRRQWRYVLRPAGIGPGDLALFAFDFAPVLWFWAGFEQAQEDGVLCIPGGAMTALQRVQQIFELGVTVLMTTADDALRLAETATQHGYRPARGPVRAVVYAARVGTDPIAVRRAVEEQWSAEAWGVTWLTEAGLTGFECEAHPSGPHLLETECICEVLDPATGAPVPDGQMGELVVTPLGRSAMPVVRYRTGDLVRVETGPCTCGRTLRRLNGGILGKVGGGDR